MSKKINKNDFRLKLLLIQSLSVKDLQKKLDIQELFERVRVSNSRMVQIKEKLIPFYEGYPDIQNVLKEEPVGLVPNKPDFGKDLDYQDTLDYLLMNDKHYEGTQWEMNLFKVFPELEEYHQPKDSGLDIINT